MRGQPVVRDRPEMSLTTLARRLHPAVLTLLPLAAIVVVSSVIAYVSKDSGQPTSDWIGNGRVLGQAPEVGGVIVSGPDGVWRFDARRGMLLHIGTSGRPTADGGRYIVRADDGTLALADPQSGSSAPLAVSAAVDADWIGAGRPMAYVDGDGLTLYEGVRSRTLPAPGVRAVRLSADGSRAMLGLSTETSAVSVNRLVAVSLASEAQRSLVVEQSDIVLVPVEWSPDGEFFAYLRRVLGLGIASLRVVQVDSGRVWDLGATSADPDQVVWKAPHVLAFVAGAAAESWRDKVLTLWSPEVGPRAVTSPNEVGLAPTWAPDGRLWFVIGEAGQDDPAAFIAGRGIGDRSVVAVDPVTGKRTSLGRANGYADEGVRLSADGRSALVLRRKLAVGQSPAVTNVELWFIRSDGSGGTPLVRISVGDESLHGTFPSLGEFAWSTD